MHAPLRTRASCRIAIGCLGIWAIHTLLVSEGHANILHDSVLEAHRSPIRMPDQNRVLPTGDIIATHARGTLMGNRGIPRSRHENAAQTTLDA